MPQTEESIFAEALSCADPQQRADFVARACGDDAALRSQVEELLQHHAAAAGFLETPVVSPADQTSRPHSAISTGRPSPDGAELRWSAETALAQLLTPADDPTLLGTIGPYAVTEMIGRGGMGVVLKARDDSLGRTVAIKVLAPELAGNATARKRFLREGRAAAAITHPHVVTIHAVAEDRLPYLVMEFICGQTLQAKLDEVGALPLAETLRIGSQIAAGLAAAHAQGVIHRDIKPPNVLLENGVERARITDFGLARAVDDVDITQTGEVAGTPPYMSPEQAQGHAVDARSDLFSLGCLLYAMCTGRSPFRGETAVATLRRVCDDPPRPISQINPDVPEWLEALIEQLLEKSPDDRIQTAAEVADLLQQYLGHVQNPRVVPLPPAVRSSHRRVRRPSHWSRRFAAALLLVVAAASLGVTEATGLTRVGATVVRIVTGEGTLVIETDDPTVRVSLDGEELTISGGGVQEVRLRPGQYQFVATRDGQPVKQELVTITRGGEKVVTVSREAVEPRTATSLASDEIRRIDHGPGVLSVAISPDGRRALFGGIDAAVWLTDLTGDAKPRAFEGHTRPITSVAFSPDGRRALSGGYDGTVRLWDVESGNELRRLEGHTEIVWRVVFFPDGRRAASGGGGQWKDNQFVPATDTDVRIWDLETGEETRRLTGHNDYVLSVAISPDGRRALTGCSNGDHAIRIWDLETGEESGRLEGHALGVYRLAFSADGRRALSASADRTIRLWDLETRTVVGRFNGHTLDVTGAAFSPDGRYVVSSSWDRTVRLWDLDSHDEVHRFKGHFGSIREVAFLPDGRSVLSGAEDGTVRVWELPHDIEQ